MSFWYLLARRLFSTYPMEEIPRELPVPDLIGREAVLGSALDRGPSLGAKATACGSECGLLPSPTRFLEVFAFPLLHLHVVEQEGELITSESAIGEQSSPAATWR